MAITNPTTPAIPRFQKALVATGPGTLALKAVPLPTIESDQVLVKVAAVALNPSDHKLLDQSTTVGAISGSDYAGIVVKVGKNVRSPLNVGDRVFGVVFGANPGNPTNGAFGNFVAAPADLCMRIPEDMAFETAASLGMGVMTVGLCFRSLGLQVKGFGNSHSEYRSRKEYVLVYGGATATGTIAIQMLKNSGYLPVVTCSPKNFELVKSRGAVAAFDYKSATCKDEIRRFTEGRLAHALDCIGNAMTMTICYGAIGNAGGRYCSLELYPRRLTIRRRNVKHDWVLGWTLFGKPVKLAGAYARPALPEDLAFGTEWVKMMNIVLALGSIQPHPLEVNKGGLTAIPLRLNDLRAGQVSGKKLVFLV